MIEDVIDYDKKNTKTGDGDDVIDRVFGGVMHFSSFFFIIAMLFDSRNTP